MFPTCVCNTTRKNTKRTYTRTERETHTKKKAVLQGGAKQERALCIEKVGKQREGGYSVRQCTRKHEGKERKKKRVADLQKTETK